MIVKRDSAIDREELVGGEQRCGGQAVTHTNNPRSQGVESCSNDACEGNEGAQARSDARDRTGKREMER